MAPKIFHSVTVRPGAYCQLELGRALQKHLILNEHSLDSLVKRDFSVNVCGHKIQIQVSRVELFDDKTWKEVRGVDFSEIQEIQTFVDVADKDEDDIKKRPIEIGSPHEVTRDELEQYEYEEEEKDDEEAEKQLMAEAL